MPTFRCLFLPHFYPRQLIYEEEEEEREKSLQCWVTATIVNRLFLSTAESAPESVERDGWLTEENHYHQCPGNSRLHLVSFFCRESMDALFWRFGFLFCCCCCSSSITNCGTVVSFALVLMLLACIHPRVTLPPLTQSVFVCICREKRWRKEREDGDEDEESGDVYRPPPPPPPLVIMRDRTWYL